MASLHSPYEFCNTLYGTFQSEPTPTCVIDLSHSDSFLKDVVGIDAPEQLCTQVGGNFANANCTLDVAQGEFNREILAPEITMPNLSFFFISWDWLVDVGPILDVLNTPNLKRLGLRGPPPTRRQWTHLRHFIKRGRPALTQLSIKEIGFEIPFAQ